MIWKCKCGSTQVVTTESQIVETHFDLDAAGEKEQWYIRGHAHPGDEPDILTSAECYGCDYMLTDDELALVAKSISGLVLSGHPYVPVNPGNIKGYVVVNPAHPGGTPVVLGWDDPYVWPDYEDRLRAMYYIAKENDNEYLYVGMVLKVTDFTEIADRYTYCEECGEVYDPRDHDECPGCTYELAL